MNSEMSLLIQKFPTLCIIHLQNWLFVDAVLILGAVKLMINTNPWFFQLGRQCRIMNRKSRFGDWPIK